jgi:hypothetical protein
MGTLWLSKPPVSVQQPKRPHQTTTAVAAPLQATYMRTLPRLYICRASKESAGILRRSKGFPHGDDPQLDVQFLLR